MLNPRSFEVMIPVSAWRQGMAVIEVPGVISDEVDPDAQHISVRPHTMDYLTAVKFEVFASTARKDAIVFTATHTPPFPLRFHITIKDLK